MKTTNFYHKHILILFVLSLISNNNVVLSQTCDVGFTYLVSIGCRSTASTILSMAYCSKPGANSGYDYMQVMSASLTPETTCPTGFNSYATHIANLDPNLNTIPVYTIAARSNIAGNPDNFITLYSPGGFPSTPDFKIYELLLFPKPDLVFSAVNRYLIQYYCGSTAGIIATSLYEVRSEPLPAPDYCTSFAYGTKSLISYYVWEYGGTTKCPIGYEGPLPCTPINQCTTNNGGCSQNCSSSLGIANCSCVAGYSLGSDGKTCVDVDECILNTSSCDQNCTNIDGSFFCSCNSGFELDVDQANCVDIDECKGSNLCDNNTVCENNLGSYSCQCLTNYSRVTAYLCELKPIISSFYQKPIESHVFIIQGFGFDQDSIIIIENENGEVKCNYKSGKDTLIECTTNQGIEVRGNVTIESYTLVSDKFEFIGAPFLLNYSSNPSTSGNDQITFIGRKFPTTGNVKFSIDSKDCPIISRIGNEQIIVSIPEGSGSLNNLVKIENEFVSNTDSLYLTYANPIITSTSVVYQSGGILTIYGFNFGPSIESPKVKVKFGTHLCNNVKVLSHNQLTCQLDATKKIYSQLLDMVVDGLPVSNKYYFEYSTLEEGICPSGCNSGKCTPFGCVCPQNLAGIACNETSIEIIPVVSNPDVPSVEMGNGNGFGYKITILRIEELDFNNVVLNDTLIPLSNAKWNTNSNIDNKWSFNITLDNKSNLEATFEYFKQSRNISFSSTLFNIPSKSLKLSFKTKQWPFQSKLNTLRVVIKTETIILNENVKECSIGNSITTTYNQHLWSTTENSESGLTARFISVAELDETYSITANIEDLSNNSNKNSIIGISVPYFSKQSIIDPDFSMLLNMDKKETGNCKPSENNKTNWKLATGLSIGGAGVVCLGIGASYTIRKKKINQKFKNLLNNKMKQMN